MAAGVFLTFSCIQRGSQLLPESAALVTGREDGGRWAASGLPFPDADLLQDHAGIQEKRWKQRHKYGNSVSGWTEIYLKGFQQGFEKPRYRFLPAIDLPEEQPR